MALGLHNLFIVEQSYFFTAKYFYERIRTPYSNLFVVLPKRYIEGPDFKKKRVVHNWGNSNKTTEYTRLCRYSTSSPVQGLEYVALTEQMSWKPPEKPVARRVNRKSA